MFYYLGLAAGLFLLVLYFVQRSNKSLRKRDRRSFRTRYKDRRNEQNDPS